MYLIYFAGLLFPKSAFLLLLISAIFFDTCQPDDGVFFIFKDKSSPFVNWILSCQMLLITNRSHARLLTHFRIQQTSLPIILHASKTNQKELRRGGGRGQDVPYVQLLNDSSLYFSLKLISLPEKIMLLLLFNIILYSFFFFSYVYDLSFRYFLFLLDTIFRRFKWPTKDRDCEFHGIGSN